MSWPGSKAGKPTAGARLVFPRPGPACHGFICTSRSGLRVVIISLCSVRSHLLLGVGCSLRSLHHYIITMSALNSGHGLAPEGERHSAATLVINRLSLTASLIRRAKKPGGHGPSVPLDTCASALGAVVPGGGRVVEFDVAKRSGAGPFCVKRREINGGGVHFACVAAK